MVKILASLRVLLRGQTRRAVVRLFVNLSLDEYGLAEQLGQ